MDMTKGYYSLIQYCPDRGRLETVNVGLVLLCPEHNFLKVRLSSSNTRLKKLVGGRGFDTDAINAAKQAMFNRLTLMREKITSAEDLERFAATRANDLLLTNPRPTAVADPEADLLRLYDDLVGEPLEQVDSSGTVHRQLDSELRRTIIDRPSLAGRIQANCEVEVPDIGRSFKANFAYNNGCRNLVRGEVFSRQEGHAINQAEKLGVESLIVQSVKAPDGRQQKVIIIPDSETPNSSAARKVEKIFMHLGVRVVPRLQLAELALEIEREAHE